MLQKANAGFAPAGPRTWSADMGHMLQSANTVAVTAGTRTQSTCWPCTASPLDGASLQCRSCRGLSGPWLQTGHTSLCRSGEFGWTVTCCRQATHHHISGKLLTVQATIFPELNHAFSYGRFKQWAHGLLTLAVILKLPTLGTRGQAGSGTCLLSCAHRQHTHTHIRTS